MYCFYEIIGLSKKRNTLDKGLYRMNVIYKVTVYFSLFVDFSYVARPLVGTLTVIL